MFKRAILFTVAVIVTGWTSVAAATLVGDTVTIGRYINGGVISDGSCCGPFETVVQAGNADLTAVSTGNNVFVNVEANSIIFEFGPNFGGGGGIPDHEILVEGLDWIGNPAALLSGFNLVTNFASITESLVSFDDHSIGLQVGPLSWFGQEGYFAELVLETNPDLVPVPSTLLLFSIGLFGLSALRACKKLAGAHLMSPYQF